MHVLFVWAWWQYPEVAIEFLQKIKERNHKVSVLLGKCENVLETKLSEIGVRLYCVPSLHSISRMMGTPYPIFKKVSPYIKIVNPDIVHVNSHLFLSNYQAVKASHLLEIPSVLTVHGFRVRRSWVLDMLQGIYFRTVARRLFKKVSAVICLTKSDAECVARIIGSDDKIVVVPNGVQTDFFKPASVKDPNLITWVGRLVPEKGLVYLVKAMKKVLKEHCNAKLVLIGEGPSKRKLMKLVSELGLDDKVTFIGSIGRIEVARCLSRSSVFAFPSLKEGMPMALLEAMASSNAIVASDIPGIDEIIRNDHNGVLFSLGNTDELASALLMLLANRKFREKLAHNARKTVQKRYSWSSVLTKLERVYQSFS